MFRENLHRVFRETYDMVKTLNFSAEYIDSLSPADRRLYIYYYEKDVEEEKKKRASSNSAPSLGSLPMDGM